MKAFNVSDNRGLRRQRRQMEMEMKRINNGVVQFINNIPFHLVPSPSIRSIRCWEMPLQLLLLLLFWAWCCQRLWFLLVVFVCEAGHELTIHHSPFAPTHEFVSSLPFWSSLSLSSSPAGASPSSFYSEKLLFCSSPSLHSFPLCVLCVVCFSPMAADPPLALHHFLQIIMMDRGILSCRLLFFFFFFFFSSPFSIEDCILFFFSSW